jgi:hypothetical protein
VIASRAEVAEALRCAADLLNDESQPVGSVISVASNYLGLPVSAAAYVSTWRVCFEGDRSVKQRLLLEEALRYDDEVQS